MALDELALGVQSQQLIGHVAHGALGFRLGLLPADSAKFVERRLMTLSARVPLHQIEPFDRNVKLRFVGVIEQHELAAFGSGDGASWLRWTEIERDEAAEARDAVIDMHHEVVDFEIAKV